MTPQEQFLSNVQMYSAYSRLTDNGKKESFDEMIDRVLHNENGLFSIGKLTDEEKNLIEKKLRGRIAFGSARYLWIGGTEWLGRDNSNHFAPFNCISMKMNHPEVFGYSMNLGMQGCGVGQVLELEHIDQLPNIISKINLTIVGEVGQKKNGAENIKLAYLGKESNNTLPKLIEWFDLIESNYKGINIYPEKEYQLIVVGDSRMGWVNAYQSVIDAAYGKFNDYDNEINIILDVSNVRGYGERLKGFGGVSNPVYLKDFFVNVAKILNGAYGRKLTSLEVMLILEEAAKNTVSGNIRRVAGMKQGNPQDDDFITAKYNLWVCDSEGKWKIDPRRDALRMSNHTAVYHTIPSLETIKQSVTKQFYSGEGAIQYAPEAIARANVDLLDTHEKKCKFIRKYLQSKDLGRAYLSTLWMVKNDGYDIYRFEIQDELDHRMSRYGLNPCAEVIGSDFRCNLGTVHLSQVGLSLNEQIDAFRASALQVVPLLHLDVDIPRFKRSHALDPIVLVSATQVNQWFINYFGTEWVYWWLEGRPNSKIGLDFKSEEKNILYVWRKTVEMTVQQYCELNGLRVPNRCTGFKPEGSLSWLSGNCGFSGIHFPPSGSLIYIRRKTFLRDDPIALAAIDYGYPVVPSTDCKDENGHLLDDPFDQRVTSWLLEIPVRESILDKYPELSQVNFNRISATAQFDWVMQMQKYYSGHNTSCTINFREDEIEDLSQAIYRAIVNNEGYISAALLARFESNETFPRLPFEPITEEKYNKLTLDISSRRKRDVMGNEIDFEVLIKQRIAESQIDFTSGEVACSSEICEIK